MMFGLAETSRHQICMHILYTAFKLRDHAYPAEQHHYVEF